MVPGAAKDVKSMVIMPPMAVWTRVKTRYSQASLAVLRSGGPAPGPLLRSALWPRT